MNMNFQRFQQWNKSRQVKKKKQSQDENENEPYNNQDKEKAVKEEAQQSDTQPALKATGEWENPSEKTRLGQQFTKPNCKTCERRGRRDLKLSNKVLLKTVETFW